MSTLPTTEERIWSVFAHLSALAFGMGILLPIIGWSEQRRKSNHASFQSLQALGYQSVGFTIWILSYLVLFVVVLIVVVVMSFQAENASRTFNPLSGLGPIAIFIMAFGFLALYFVLPICAAIACALGKDFRYPLMGNRLARYLGYDSTQQAEEQTWLNEYHEFRWVAAMGHFSILILLWGMLAPLTTWMLYGKRSQFLRFQSIQTLVYQAGTTVLYFVALAMYLLGFFALILPAASAGEPNLNSTVGMVGLVIFGIFLLIALLIMIFIPLLHILGQWAGYRVLKGADYRYPLVGRLVEKWISKNSTIEENLI
jgi:uncharacterized Tic20 family protein